jgi:hypothetical protein
VLVFHRNRWATRAREREGEGESAKQRGCWCGEGGRRGRDRMTEVWMGLCGATVFGGIPYARRFTVTRGKGKNRHSHSPLHTTYMQTLLASQYRTGRIPSWLHLRSDAAIQARHLAVLLLLQQQERGDTTWVTVIQTNNTETAICTYSYHTASVLDPNLLVCFQL